MAKKAINKAIQDALNETLGNAQIKAAIEDAMRNEVFDVIKVYGRKAIQETVYDVYEPTWYTRRYDDGGALDENNWIIGSTGVKNMSMVINNEMQPNPVVVNFNTGEVSHANVTTDKDLSYLIVKGYDVYPRYDFPREGREYMEPRDFITSTANKLRAHSYDTHEAMAEGLIRNGFTVGIGKVVIGFGNK